MAFSMLDIEGDDLSDGGVNSEEEVPKQLIEPILKGKKNKKSKKGGAQTTGDDLDSLLANIEAPTDKLSKKDKKKRAAAAAAAVQNGETAEAGTAEELPPSDNDQDTETAALVSPPAPPEDAVAMTADELADEMDRLEIEKKASKKKKKKQKGGDTEEPADAASAPTPDADGQDGPVEGEHTVKTAAQKKKEKKEREKEKKKKQKQTADVVAPTTQNRDSSETPAVAAEPGTEPADDGEGEDDNKTDKKKKKKDKGVKEKVAEKKKPSKAIKLMQEQLARQKAEEERLVKEEEDRFRREEEAIQAVIDKKKQEEAQKEAKKRKLKEKIERQKQEGTYLTDKQKREKKIAMERASQLMQNAQFVPGETHEKKRPMYGKKRVKQPKPDEASAQSEEPQVEPPTPEPAPIQSPVAEPDILDSWEDDVPDAWDNDDEAAKEPKQDSSQAKDEAGDEDSETESESGSGDLSGKPESESEEESSSEEEEEELTPIERARARIQKRKELAESMKNTDVLRAPVVCVLGHVDTGKTKILDKLRHTNVQDNEAGGITQQIGATNVPQYAIKDQTKMCKEFSKRELKLPGLLIIDTPGHESFSNLRTRGSSLCDIAILVVDIMHGLEQQTIESINLLKKGHTPFVVALNKIDRLYGWKPCPHLDVQSAIKKQSDNTKHEFDQRTQKVIAELAEHASLNAALSYANTHQKTYVSLVPTSAHSGDGMGSLIALLCELSQTRLAERLASSEDLQATVMEVKSLPGLGTTVDVILVNGKLRVGDQIVVPGTEGPIVTHIRELLLPQPMKELRVKSQYMHEKEVHAAQGVKIIGKDMEKVFAGLPLYVAQHSDEIEVYKEWMAATLKSALSSIKLKDRGVFVQASTLGSLEALLEYLRSLKVPYAGVNIGPVHKKDIMKANVMVELKEPQYACILAFDVKVEREAQDLADNLGVKIFTADIIYHLFDAFEAHLKNLLLAGQKKMEHVKVFPCRLRVIPDCVFKTRDPIIMGVAVEAGIIVPGTPLSVPSKECLYVGRVSGVELNNKPVQSAKKGQEVCIKIENDTGDAPKMFNRHFDETDRLVSRISRESIDAVKKYWKEDLTKEDWKLMIELKKDFDIM